MKKRNLALMTAALVLALTACGGGSSSETKVSGETDKAETRKRSLPQGKNFVLSTVKSRLMHS